VIKPGPIFHKWKKKLFPTECGLIFIHFDKLKFFRFFGFKRKSAFKTNQVTSKMTKGWCDLYINRGTRKYWYRASVKSRCDPDQFDKLQPWHAPWVTIADKSDSTETPGLRRVQTAFPSRETVRGEVPIDMLRQRQLFDPSFCWSTSDLFHKQGLTFKLRNIKDIALVLSRSLAKAVFTNSRIILVLIYSHRPERKIGSGS
jgi:hypothetical protein